MLKVMAKEMVLDFIAMTEASGMNGLICTVTR